MNDTTDRPTRPAPTRAQLVQALLLSTIPFLLVSFPSWPTDRADAAVPVSATGMMPASSLVSLEIADIDRALEVLGRSRYFRPRTKARPSRNVDARTARLTRALGGLCYSFDLPYRDGLVAALTVQARRASGPLSFGLLARGPRTAVPIVAMGVQPEAARSWSTRTGLFSTQRGGLWIASTDPREAEGFRPGRPMPTGADAPLYRLRIRVRELYQRRARGLPHVGVLDYLLGTLPEVVEVTWQNGREVVRVSAPGVAKALVPYGGKVKWPWPERMSFNYAFAGRLDLPAGLSMLTRALEKHPLAIRRALLRAWPTKTPSALDAAKHLTGRFQVVSIFNSQNLVPVIGLELRSPRRSLLALDQMLLASGLCERQDDEVEPGQLMYVARKPQWMYDHALRWFIRRYKVRYRQYRIAYGSRWLWLGPKDEVESVLRALPRAGEGGGLGVTESTASDGGDPVLGAFAIEAGAMWRSIIYELNDLGGTYPSSDFTGVMDSTLKMLRKSATQRYEVTAEGDNLVLTRATTAEASVFGMLAGHAAGAHALVKRTETTARERVQSDLRGLMAAQFAHRDQASGFASDLASLERRGLWRPSLDADYRFRIRAEGQRFVIVATPRKSGATGWRPAFAIRENGTIYRGSETNAAAALNGKLESLAGWTMMR